MPFSKAEISFNGSARETGFMEKNIAAKRMQIKKARTISQEDSEMREKPKEEPPAPYTTEHNREEM